jgi:alpha-tubulin suppressor-like RCC1 family protein
VSLSDKRWKKVRAGTAFSLALEENGEIWYWGLITSQNESDVSLMSLQPQKIGGFLSGKKIVDIAAGGLHALAVSENGEVFAWGDNRNSQLGFNDSKKIHPEPFPLFDLFGKDIIKVAAGEAHSVALNKNGEVWTWGEGRVGQLGHGKLQNEVTPKRVDTLKGVKIVDICAGELQTFFISDEGTVFVCGSDENYLFGLLRSPRWNPTPLPIALPEKKRIKKIAAYHFQTLAIDEEGGLWTWGRGHSGLLGREDLPKRGLPHRVKIGKNGEEKAVHIAAGYKTSLCFSDGGHLWVWGSPFFDAIHPENIGKKPKLYTTPHLIDEGVTVLDLSCGFDHSLVLTEVSVVPL